jgi:type VI secretion system FHA domain protein
MQLRLIVVRDPRRTLGEGTVHVFTEAGGTVGRNTSCDLVLADVANVISSRHAEFSFNGRGFLITDISTNGVYLNRTDAPLGRGNSALLASGDVLYLGDLVFKIDVGEEQRDVRARVGLRPAEGWAKAQPGITPKAPPPSGIDGFAGSRPAAGTDPLAGFAPSRLPMPNAKHETQDPLAALNAPAIPQEDLLAPRPSARPPFELPPFPVAPPRPTIAAARQVPSPPTLAGVAPPPPRPPENHLPELSPALPSIPGPIPDLSALLPEPLPGSFAATPNPSILGAFPPDPAWPTPAPPAPTPQLPPVHVQTPPSGATVIPDDFFAHLSGLPGFPGESAPSPPSPSTPVFAPSQSLPPANPVGQRPVLPPDFAASLVTLGRKDARGEAPSATPSLDPVSILRRRGEGRPDPDATRSPPLRPPPAPRVAPSPAGSGVVPPPAAAPRPGSDEFAAFWQVLGLDPARLDPARRAAMLQTLATLIRESVNGLVEVLSARSAIKDEFRMDRTRLQPDENNPLKFFRTGAEALHRTVIDPAPGFLALDAAAKNGFADIKAHEVASMTALQNSMKQLFLRLSPSVIEQAAGQSMFGRRPDKAKLWDQFVELYNHFTDTLEFSVPEIVATEFARVYREQIEQMNRGDTR